MSGNNYNHSEVEDKIYSYWEKNRLFQPKKNKKKFSIVIPPPNVTGNLHMGHALNNSIQDLLTRFHRMNNYETLWQPGTDHAGIATQALVEKKLEKEGHSKHDLGREKFINQVWEWKNQYGDIIINQLKKLGCSCDWSRNAFTMDENLSKSVIKVFVDLYKKGLIYKSKKLVNWDTVLKTAISDLEVDQREVNSKLYYIKYPMENSENFITIATTRPETMLGDTAVAVNPKDKRYKNLVSKNVILPIVEKKIKIIADDYADPEQGTGAVKITPAHDFNDYEVGIRNKLEIINIFTEDGKINKNAPSEYVGLDRFEARKKIISELKNKNLFVKDEDIKNKVPYGDRSNSIIEPYLTEQWFADAKKLSNKAKKIVRSKKTKFFPTNWSKTYFQWMDNIEPWCVSRQLWWGHQIPAWYGPDGKVFVEYTEEEAIKEAKNYYKKDVELKRDEDVLDTWFSSGLWPFATLGWPNQTEYLKKFYPTTVLVTGFDIIFFWVARMMMMGMAFLEKEPFKDIYVHALVRDEKGQKMSKSKGNVIDPLILMDEFGADSLRMTLCSMAAQGRDIKLSKQRVEGYRNFITKIWNAVKLCEMNECLYEDFEIKNTQNIFNLWILNELEICRKKTEQSIKDYKFNEAANALYKFTWSIFCDWYLEITKIIYSSNDKIIINETKQITSLILSKILVMLHPIIPFFTEHVWDQAANILEKGSQRISQSQWPQKLDFEALKSEKVNLFINLISSIRSTRAELNVPAKSKVNISYSNVSSDLEEMIEKNKEIIISLTRSDSFEKEEYSKDEGMVQVIFNDGLIYLSLKGIIDFEEEKRRLQKNLKKTELELSKIHSKLNDKNFINNAPEEIILEQKEREKEYQLSKDKITKTIQNFE